MSVVPVAGPRTSSSGWSWSGPPPSAAAAAPNPRHRAFPFVAATSTSPSHNTQLCLQSVLSQRKMRRPSTSPSTGTYGPNNGAPFPRPSTPGVPLRSRPPTAVLTTPCPCPLLNADIGDTDSCGTGDSAGSSAGSVRLDQDEALDHQNDKLAKQSLQGRWATEASSKCQSSTAAARCQCYPRHVAEYDHVLKPFLRKAATGRDLRPAPSPRTSRVPRVTGKTGKPGKPKPPPLHRATTRAAKTASPEPSVRPKTPAVKVNNPPTPRAGCRFDVDELRSVVVSLRQDLVALGAARDAERKRGSRGRRLKELKELEDGLERKEAELRVIVDLYRQVQQLRSEMSNARRFDSTIEESSPALHS